MLDIQQFKQDLLYKLQQRRIFKKASSKQFYMRCPLCGDSRKNANKARFYVKIDMENDDEPVLFNCYNCNSGGVMTPNILKALSIDDREITTGLRILNNRSARINTRYNTKQNTFSYTMPKGNPNNELHVMKKEYIESRLGKSFTFDELTAMKTIFSLGDFLLTNKIEKINCGEKKALELDKNYVGWLTINNETINFRQTMPSTFERYEKYSIIQGLNNTLKFYVIPTIIDVLSPEKFYINITEGVFDIYGVFYHIDNGGKDNSVYIAACGSGFRVIVDYVIRLGLIGNVALNIYSDTDKDPSEYRYILEDYGDWIDEVNLFYNGKNDDFGHPKSKIIVNRSLIR